MINFVSSFEWLSRLPKVLLNPHDFSQVLWKSERDRGDEKSNCTTFFRNSKWLRQKITYVSFASMSLNNHYSISYLGWYKMCANLLLWRAADAHCLEKWKFVQKLCILKHKKSPKNLKFYRCSIYTLQSLWYFNM